MQSILFTLSLLILIHSFFSFIATLSVFVLCLHCSPFNPITPQTLYWCRPSLSCLSFSSSGVLSKVYESFHYHRCNSCHCASTVSRVSAFPTITFPTVTMFAAPQDPSPRMRSTSHSTDDHSSTKDRPRKSFQRYAHDLTMSSQSLAITSSTSHHDDLPTPSAPTLALHTSAHSTPMTSPSTGYSSLFPGSLSSATSESAPSAEYRSEFGLLMSGSSAYSPAHGSTSSHSSQPVSPRSQSITESDAHLSPPQLPCRSPSPGSSHRPSTAPHSPLLATPSIPPTEHHTRSHSKLTASIKNFLSRPAIPSPSRFSFNSSTAPSDSETSFCSFQIPATTGKWSLTPRKPRPPNLEISGSVAAAAIPSPSRDSSLPTDVHRRYASEAAAKIYYTRTGNSHPTSQESLDLPVQNVPPVLGRGREPKTRNVLRRRPSGSAKLLKARERGMSSPPRPHGADADLLPKASASRLIETPFPLTPAGAVVEAYKQQELHRDDMPSPPKLSIVDRMNDRASHDGGYGQEHSEKSPTPYYTVFGSSSERRVKAGDPDDRWDRFEADQPIWNTSRVTPSHQPSASDPSGRSLTRKVSSKWRKVKGGGMTSEESPARDRGHSKGQPSLQEIWGSDKSGTRSTGRSMDSAPSTREGAWSSPSGGHTRSGSDKDGGKIWRLMRRISTGGLRDRFQSDKVIPPVPAIPKELLMKVNQDERSNERVSMPRHQPSLSLQDKERTPPFKNILATPPSVAIASTSSNSSDVASTQFFQKTHSARSSVSSYGEAVVTSRSPETALNQRIIAPVEQLRLGDDHAGGSKVGASLVSRSPRRSASVPAALRTVEDAQCEHVPLPSPRRQTCSGDSPSCASSRPSSTSTPASGSGVRQSRTVDGIVSLSPPPRSARNSTRGASTASSPSHSVLIRQMDGGGGIGIVGARQLDRMPSGQSDMTARAQSPESGQLRDQNASSHTRTGLTFRKLGAPRRPPLTEREKLDIWNDLLDRSDKAGGTLHINGAAELMSDNLRFSMHSET